MAVSVRKPVLYAFGVVLCAGIIGGIWLWYRTHCVLITNDSTSRGRSSAWLPACPTGWCRSW